MQRQKLITLLFVLLCAVVMQPIFVSATTTTRTGVFVWRHGDDQQGQPVERYFLQNGDEELRITVSDILLAQAGGARAIDGRLVRIEIDENSTEWHRCCASGVIDTAGPVYPTTRSDWRSTVVDHHVQV